MCVCVMLVTKKRRKYCIHEDDKWCDYFVVFLSLTRFLIKHNMNEDQRSNSVIFMIFNEVLRINKLTSYFKCLHQLGKQKQQQQQKVLDWNVFYFFLWGIFCGFCVGGRKPTQYTCARAWTMFFARNLQHCQIRNIITLSNSI